MNAGAPIPRLSSNARVASQFRMVGKYEPIGNNRDAIRKEFERALRLDDEDWTENPFLVPRSPPSRTASPGKTIVIAALVIGIVALTLIFLSS